MTLSAFNSVQGGNVPFTSLADMVGYCNRRGASDGINHELWRYRVEMINAGTWRSIAAAREMFEVVTTPPTARAYATVTDDKERIAA